MHTTATTETSETTPADIQIARLRAENRMLRELVNRWQWLENSRISDTDKINNLAAVLEARREGWPDPEIVGTTHGSS